MTSLIALLCLSAAPQVTLESLLDEMTDRTAVTHISATPYTVRQASSHDPAAKTPGNEQWWANGDMSNFVGEQTRDGQVEKIMIDQDGPGAITRFWITGAQYNRTIRFYLDDMDTPAFEMPLATAIGGEGFGPDPFSYESARGRNLYLPIPYSKHVRVTVEGKDMRETKDFNDNLYYQIVYRTYAPGTAVRTLSRAGLELEKDKIRATANLLLQPETRPSTATKDLQRTIEAGKSVSVEVNGPGEINNLVLSIANESNRERIARQLIMRIEFDGTETVWAPIGDFFGTGFGHDPLNSWWRFHSEGTYSSAWVMPFQRSARVTLENRSNVPVGVTLYVGSSETPWTSNSLHFHAHWHMKSMRTKGGTGTEDFNFCDVKGPGVYVGDNIVLRNAVASWWGEGDEKVYVDGESYPSTFGTGTEDYYGYAWCTPEYFSKPFNAQPQVTGPGNAGLTTNLRDRSLDAIPFTSGLKFDIEIWHWASTDLDYASTALFYAKPGLNPAPRSPEMVAEEVWRPVPAGGFEVLDMSGGTAASQDISSFGKGIWDKDDQLWWTGAEVGDKLSVALPSQVPGDYRVEFGLTKAPDYGIVQLWLNGARVGGPIDLYDPKVVLSAFTFNGVKLDGRPMNTLTVEILGKNEKAVPAYMFGLDTVRFKRIVE
jgi:hypothetical protein